MVTLGLDAVRPGAGHNPIPGAACGAGPDSGVLIPSSALRARELGLCPKPALLDASGRKVMDLHPGANDVSRLPAGVYFVREAQAQAQAQAVHKVVIQK